MEFQATPNPHSTTVSNGTTAWTVRFSVREIDRVHYKVFRNKDAADKFAHWWNQRGELYAAFLLPR